MLYMLGTQYGIGQLHVSNGILMKRVIAREVTAGVLGGVLKCIGVYGNSMLPLFKTRATRQVYRMCYLSESRRKLETRPHT